MEAQLIPTDDGSSTLRIDEMDETYHSTNGALTESQYVYITNGLLKTQTSHLNILEVGFGTGLNALATLDTFLRQDNIKSITYTTLEKYPIDADIIKQLGYGNHFDPDRNREFSLIHEAEWEKEIEITSNFTIYKRQFDLLSQELTGNYDLVYYDAFAPSKQAEMWGDSPIQKVADSMQQGALLTTYCAQGDAKRAFRKAGLTVKRLPGPPGKWHMLNVHKL